MKQRNNFAEMQGAMRQGNLGAQAMGGRMAQRPAAQFAAAQMANQAQLGMKKGGETMKESKAMAKKEIAFMKKKGAPKSMIKHEKAEYGMKKGGMASSYRRVADGIASKGKTKGKQIKMNMGGKC